MTSEEIIAAARGFVGVRFRHQGRGRDGLDCLGLLIATADAAGLSFGERSASQLDAPDYTRKPDAELLQAKLESHLLRVQSMQAGDVLLLEIDGRAQHLAIVSDYPAGDALGMIHAYAPARRVVEHRIDDTWMGKVRAIYRLPPLA